MRNPTRWMCSLTIAVALSVSCSHSSPSGPSVVVGTPGVAVGSDAPDGSAGTCRTYATDYSFITLPGRQASTIVNCSFNRAGRTLLCSYSQRGSEGCSVDFEKRGFYDALGDFVDEIPGRRLLTRETTTFTSGATTCAAGVREAEELFTYDAFDRLTLRRGRTAAAALGHRYLFRSWDAKDRVTAASLQIPGLPDTQISYAYDDERHTTVETRLLPGTPVRVLESTFDADGIVLHERSEDRGVILDTIYTVTAREQVCE
jgi:hypothetical protein